MKKIISIICFICIILATSSNTYALESKRHISYTYLKNRICLETIIEEKISLFSTQTKSGSKTQMKYYIQ